MNRKAFRLDSYWCKYQGIEFGLSDIFEKKVRLSAPKDIGANFNFEFNGRFYIKHLQKELIESAYRVFTWGEVDGFGMQIGNYVNGRYSLLPDTNKEGAIVHFGTPYSREHGGYRAIWHTEAEILSFWEVRTPIEGFPFKTEPKVYLKKDGIWLDESYKPSGN